MGLTAAQTLDAALRSWNTYCDSAPQHDDASLLLLDWRGRPPAPEFSTICCPENLAAIRGFVESWAVFAGFGDTTTGQIVMACDEACTNIFCHGYGQKPGPIRLRVEITGTTLAIQIADEAAPVDAREIRCRDLTDLRPGGLGTFVMTQVFDEVNYLPLEQGNTLTLRKGLPR